MNRFRSRHSREFSNLSPKPWESVKVRPSEKLGFYGALRVYRIRLHTNDEGVDLGMRPRVKGETTKEERIERYKGSKPSSEKIPDAELAKSHVKRERKGTEEDGTIWYDHSDTTKEKGLVKAKRQVEHILEGTSQEVIELTKLIAFIGSTKEELQEFLKKRRLNDFDIEIVQQTVASLKDEFKRKRTFFKYVAKETIEEMETVIDKALDKEQGKAPVFWLNQIPFHLMRVITALNKRVLELPGINKFDIKRLQLLEELELRERQQDARWANTLYWCANKMKCIEEDVELRSGQVKQLEEMREQIAPFARRVPLTVEIIRPLEGLKKFRENNPITARSLNETTEINGKKYYGFDDCVKQTIWGLEHKKTGYSVQSIDQAISMLRERIIEVESWHLVGSGKILKDVVFDIVVDIDYKGRGQRRKGAAKVLRDAVECYYDERKKSASIAKKAAEMLMNEGLA